MSPKEQSLVAEGREGQGKPSLEPSTVILKNESNSPNYNELIQLFLLLIIRKTGYVAPRQVEQFLSKLKKTGLLNSQTLAIYYFFYTERAGTITYLTEELDIDDSTAYRAIKPLIKYKLIKKLGKIKPAPGGGPKPTIYGVPDALPEDIANAQHREMKRTTPGYEFARKMSQLILDEYLPHRLNGPTEIKYIEVARFIGRNYPYGGPGGFDKSGVIDVTCKHLHEQGIKVWR